MSGNRHFWQGQTVSWQGAIIDIQAPPHGGGIHFSDRDCLTTVEVDADIVPELYPGSDRFAGHAAVARFDVEGHLSYKNGEVVLIPSSLERRSAWLAGDQFYAYLDRWRAHLLEEGKLSASPTLQKQ